MANLAVIPARGGSKRIPRKNIKEFLGKPIIAYSIEVALESRLFDEVMVSTDDEEIAVIAEQYGAKVPFLRSKEMADDFATTIQVLQEVLYEYNNQSGRTFDEVCCIYPASPLIKAEHLLQGLDLLRKEDCYSVFPVVEFSFPVWRGLKIDEKGKARIIWPEYLNARSQDLEKVYHDAGQWYWFKPSIIKHSLYSDKTNVVVLPDYSVQDIDNESDWRLAEMKYQLYF